MLILNAVIFICIAITMSILPKEYPDGLLDFNCSVPCTEKNYGRFCVKVCNCSSEYSVTTLIDVYFYIQVWYHKYRGKIYNNLHSGILVN